MKLKYYLRGMGIGIIVTTIILMISFSQREVEISDEQVMVRAAALGMVMAEEDDAPATEMSVENTEDMMLDEMPTESTETDMPEELQTESTQTESTQTDIPETVTEESEEPATEEDVPERVDMPTEGTYRLVIKKGDVCRVVCEDLQENGVVADAEALRKHLFELGYANSISTGAYDVPYGLTMEEVAQIIVAGPIEE